jgi:hypothetical protein
MMPEFTSERSIQVLSELDERLQRVCEVAIRKIDFSLIDGVRTVEQQKALFADGKSKIDGVFTKSKHQPREIYGPVHPDMPGPSGAFDFIPAPFTQWSDIKLFTAYAYYFIGLGDSLGIELRWGGDWDKDFRWRTDAFNDLPHIELVDWH